MTTNKTSWIQTYTGRKVYPLELTADQVCVEDVAHALSLKCRFAGHCRRFYSVADHSLRVAAILPPPLRLAGLLHDAAEAYLPDVAGPIKSRFLLRPGARYRDASAGSAVQASCVRADTGEYTPTFDEVEAHVLSAVFEGLGVPRPHVWSSPAIVAANRMLLATEARDLMGEPPEAWALDAPTLSDPIYPRSPAQAEADFLVLFGQLIGGGR